MSSVIPLRRSTLWAALLSVAFTGLAAGVAAAQEETGGGFFAESLDVRVVNVDVFVTDRSGKPIPGLGQGDFELIVDGEPMPISNFYSEAGGQVRETVNEIRAERRTDTSFQPIETVEADPERRAHVVVMVDHSRIRPSNRRRAFKALKEAVTQLDPGDLISVVGVEEKLVFYSDFIYDRQAIGEILDDISNVSGKVDNTTEVERRLIFGELARGQSGGRLARTVDLDSGSLRARIQAYAAQEHARSLNAIQQLERVVGTMAGIPGRKALLYVAEAMPSRPGEGLYVEWRNRFGGGSNGGAGMRRIDFSDDYTRSVGNYDLTQSMEAMALKANSAGVTMYAIDAEGNHGGMVRSALTEQGATSETISVVDESYRAPLEFATQATGGRLLRSSGSLVKELAKITRDFDTFYSLGFTPAADWEPGSNHSVQVKVKGKGRTVRHREEIRLPRPGERAAGATVAALMYQSQNNPLDIKANPGTVTPRDDGNAVVPVLIEIPVGSLVLVPNGETHDASVSIFVSVKDQDGNPGKVQSVPFHLNIPADKVEEAKQNSAHYPLPVVLRPGDREVAVSVQDDINGSLSTVRVDVSELSRSF